MPIAIMALQARCKEMVLDVRFVNTIHDSVICYVKDDEHTLRVFKHEAELAFTEDVYHYLRYEYNIDWDIPLGVGIVVGNWWGEGKEEIFDDAEGWEYGK